MVLPRGIPQGRHLRRLPTWTILGVLAVLMALPTGAFATHVAPTVSAAVPFGVASHPAAAAHQQVANAGAERAVQNTIAPILDSAGRSILPAHATPLYLQPQFAQHAAARPANAPAALHGAITSLGLGQGPAFGAPISCSASSASAASCAGAPSAHPSSVSPAASTWAWQNATPGAGTIGYPGLTLGGMMAWDNYDKAIIFYGGCDAIACPDNQTWAYIYGYWENVTISYDSPPGVYEAAMDFDYAANAVVLFGGCGAVQCPMNETWLFQGGYWYNASAPFCFYTCYFPPAPRIGAAMAFANDTSDNYTVLFGGCLDAFCYTSDNVTYLWVAYAAAWAQIGTAPTARGFASMAYDGAWGALMMFGGCAYYCSDSDTWQFYAGAWTDLTAFNTYEGFATPPARGGAEMTYYSAFGQLLMTGGIGGGSTNDLWSWACYTYYYYGYGYSYCGWSNVTPTINLPGAIDLGAMPSESSQFVPLLNGGDCTCSSGIPMYQTFVYEPLFSGTPSVSPNPSPALAPVTFTANLGGGQAPYFWYWNPTSSYYGSYFGDTTYTYPTAGTYSVSLFAYDWYGVLYEYFGTEVVTTVAASASVSHPATDLGVSETFSTPVASGGTAPYTYNWSFGDGSYAPDEISTTTTHAYGATGTYQANLTVTDTNGLTNTTSVTVTVVAAPTVTAAASASPIDLGAPITFTPTASGGTGAYTYAWSFGDTATSTSQAPSHTFATSGTFHASVTVTDAVGGTATASVTVTVNPAVSGTASGTPTSLQAGGSVAFTATGSGGSGTYTYTWAYGDGSAKVTTASANHVYATAGTYNATVWINDSLGGSFHKTIEVTVTPVPSSSSSSGLSGWTPWIIVGVVVIVAALLLAMMMMRRRKPTSTTSAPPTGAAGGGSPPPPPPGAQ